MAAGVKRVISEREPHWLPHLSPILAAMVGPLKQVQVLLGGRWNSLLPRFCLTVCCFRAKGIPRGHLTLL